VEESIEMNHLIALVFDDQFKGEEARAALHRMAGEGLLEIKDTVIVVRKPDGKTQVTQEDKVTKEGQKAGHIAGLLAAAVTGTLPFILAGTLAGRLVGRLMDHGITHKFIKDLRQEVRPGTSALILLAASDPERRREVEERMQGFGAKILRTDLPPEVEQEIEDEIDRQKAA